MKNQKITYLKSQGEIGHQTLVKITDDKVLYLDSGESISIEETTDREREIAWYKSDSAFRLVETTKEIFDKHYANFVMELNKLSCV